MSLGTMDYNRCWDLQKRLLQSLTENKKTDSAAGDLSPGYLLFVYHPSVYTLGSNYGGGDPETKFAVSEPPTEVIRVNRGGGITYHGPGQLMAYPILNLDCFFRDIYKYIRSLEQVIMKVCEHYRIVAGRLEGKSGVWVGESYGKLDRKICSIGVSASRWITMHGLAFNINPDLTFFDRIIPCGIPGVTMTSLARELQQSPPLASVEALVRKYFSEIFEVSLLEETCT